MLENQHLRAGSLGRKYARQGAEIRACCSCVVPLFWFRNEAEGIFCKTSSILEIVSYCRLRTENGWVIIYFFPIRERRIRLATFTTLFLDFESFGWVFVSCFGVKRFNDFLKLIWKDMIWKLTTGKLRQEWIADLLIHHHQFHHH